MVTQSIPLVANLRTQNRNIGTIYLATGLVTEGDTGGGIYFWNPASTNADDGFYYLQVAGVATGRWVRIYAGSNIYNTDGSLLDNRDVTLNGSYLKFIGSSANSTFNADGTVTLSSLSGVNTRMVVAGATGTLATQSFVPGTTIRFVEKFSATLGQTVFNTANTLYGDLFDVFLNGVKLNTDSFSFTANQIVLIDGSYAGDIIDVVGFSSITVYATLPSQAGNAGKFLSTDGTSLSWETVSASGFVPYTGATADVNLGEFGLSAGQLTLDVSPTGTAVVGTTRWNNTIGSSETTLKGGSVILKNGVDLVARVVNKVFPNATLTKAAYQAVRVSGAQGQRLAVAFAQANNDANSADTIGLVCETIATNQEGFIITVGQLEGINTTGSLQGETWADGDVLYLSPFTPGAITKVKPTGNGHIVVIGYVEYAHANNGKIYVKVMNGWELEELHNVDIVTPANNEALIYESSTQLWKNKTIATALGYTPISGTGVSGQVAYWNGTNSQTGSNNLFWDAANSRLGIGTNSPANQFTIASIGVRLFMQAEGAFNYAQLGTTTNHALYFTTNNSQQGRITATGNFILSGGTPADGGQRLQVYGDAFIKGSGNTSATNALLVQNSASTELVRIDNSGQVFVPNRIIATLLQSTGTATIFLSGGFGSATGGDGIQLGQFTNVTNTSGTHNRVITVGSFLPTSGTGVFNCFNVGATINQTGGANGITRGLYIAPTLTAAADWRSIEWSNNSGWGLYGAGTSSNFLNGDTAIGTATLGTATKLTIGGSETAISAIARGELNNTTLVASANNDVLVGVDISSSFTRSTFTGVASIPLRITNSDAITGVIGTTFGLQINASQTAASGLTGAQKYGLQIVGSGTFNRNTGTEVYGLHIPPYSGTVFGGFLLGAYIGNRVGIGSYNPIFNSNNSSLLTIADTFDYSTYGTNANTIYFKHNTQTSGLTAGIYASVQNFVSSGVFFTRGDANGVGWIDFVNANANVEGTLKMRLFGTGNLLIQTGGTFADAGFKLDVNGTARVSGATFIGTGSPTSFFLRGMVVSGTTGDVALGVFNSSTTGTAGFTIGESNTNFVGFYKWGSAYAGNFAGSSIPIANASQFGTGTLNNLPLIFNGTPIIFYAGVASTNVALRQSASTFKIGNVSNAHTNGNASAALEVVSFTQGFLPPRMSTFDKTNIASPAAGLQVYDTTLNQMSYYNGTTWVNF